MGRPANEDDAIAPRVLALLSEHPDGMSYAELYTVLVKDHILSRQILRVVESLEDRGDVTSDVRAGIRRYRLAATGKEALA